MDIFTLPEEIIRYEILGFMHLWELYSLRFVSRNFERVVRDILPKKRFMIQDIKITNKSTLNFVKYITVNDRKFYISIFESFNGIYNEYGECVFTGIKICKGEPEITEIPYMEDDEMISWNDVEIRVIGFHLYVHMNNHVKKILTILTPVPAHEGFTFEIDDLPWQ